jgi:hypothetical protein
MSIFVVINNSTQLGTAAVQPTDNYQNGILTDAGATLNRATTSAADNYNQGLVMTSTGQVRYVDATAGLPGNTVWSNGLPSSGGALCIAIAPMVTYSNGIPFAANGAVAATVTP